MRFRETALAGLLAAASLYGANNIFPYTYVQEDLPNGLRLITIPTDYPNIVSLFIVVGAGSRNEVEPGKSGFAHLFEHLMFRGTPEFSAEQYQDEIQKAGAASNAYTSRRSDGLPHHILEGGSAAHPLDGSRPVPAPLCRCRPLFKTETLAVLGEYNKNSASPSSKLSETAARHRFSYTSLISTPPWVS